MKIYIVFKEIQSFVNLFKIQTKNFKVLQNQISHSHINSYIPKAELIQY